MNCGCSSNSTASTRLQVLHEKYPLVVFSRIFNDRNEFKGKQRLTQPAAVAGHGHERAQASSHHTLGPAQRRLFERAGVLVQEGVDAVGGWRTAASHYGLCGKTKHW